MTHEGNENPESAETLESADRASTAEPAGGETATPTEPVAEVGVAEPAGGETAPPLEIDDEVLVRQVVPVVEALLYAAEEPIPVAEFVDIVGAVAADEERDWAAGVSASVIERAARLLADRFTAAGSALDVFEIAGGFRLGTRPQYDDCIRALRQVKRTSRMSVAALETMAVVAYRQPVTAAEIAAVRGVDPSASLRTMRDQGLVRITGRKRAVGRPFTYGTTRRFLEIFGLRDLDELPDPAEFEELLEG